MVTDPTSERVPEPASQRDAKSYTPDSSPLLVDAKTLGPMLSLCRRTVWTLTACNAIPSQQIGRARRYCVAEVRAWIDAGCPTEPGSADRVRAAMRKRLAGGAA
jgi:predicted DNA-binding transcriptional regulator AlpA